MKMWIAGAGGIGCVLGARLAGQPGVEITFVDPWQEHVDAMTRSGLTVDYPNELVHVRVNAVHVSQAGTLPSPDVVLLCVKSFQTEPVLTALRPFLGNESFVVSLQNGLNEEAIARIVGMDRTMGAIVLFDGSLIGPGHAAQVRTKPLVLGELGGETTRRIEGLATVLRASVAVLISQNIWGDLWSKLVRNLALTTVGAATGKGFGYLATDQRARRVGLLLSREAVQVAQLLDVRLVEHELFDSPPSSFLSRVGSSAFDAIEARYRAEYENLPLLQSSMLLDLQRGRQTEIDYMSGHIVRKGEELGVATPFNACMLALVHEMERGEVRPSPEALSRFDALIDLEARS